MTLISRSLTFALVTLVTYGAMAPAHAEIVVRGNIELPHQLDRSIILGDVGISHAVPYRPEGAPALNSTSEPEPQTAPPHAVVPEFLPAIPPQDAPVSDSVNSTGTLPNDRGAPQPGPEPYVMLLVGLGMIVLAITLHLKSREQARSGFKPSQGMPFV